MLGALRRPFSWPIIIVQHIAAGFTTGFAEWLGDATMFPAAVVDRRLKLEPGRLFIAADDHHLLVEAEGWVAPSRSPPRAYLRPSIDVTFESAAARGAARSVAVLLTGMGKDGAAGLKTLRERGAHTIVQDPASALVDSMPRNAIALGAACDVLSPAVMADAIVARLRGARSSG
jgi:two-component system chemotaxis response regulator CheB